MTGPDDVSRETSTPWQQYLNWEHAARDMYLAVTRHAHREYLSGPWPDRDYYLTVERDAYATYYAAGRDAWKTYRTTMENPPATPPRDESGLVSYRDSLRTAADTFRSPPPPRSHPYPPAGLSVGSSAYWPTERDVSPYPPADHSVSGAGVPYPAPSFSPRPDVLLCPGRPYPAGSEGEDGTRCMLPMGHSGPHSDVPQQPATPSPESER